MIAVEQFDVEVRSGRVTDLTCSCGGLLREVRHVVVPRNRPRHHRQRRIRKKWQKRWERENRARLAISGMMSALRHPSYRCEACGRVSGFYAAMGRNLISVQPMPGGAASIF